MSHSPSSTSQGGSAFWSAVNLVLAVLFGVVTLFIGASLVCSGIVASQAKRAPKPAKAPVAEAAPAPAAAAPAAPAAATPAAAAAASAPAATGPVQELSLSPDATNPMMYGTKSFTVKAGQPVKLTFSNKAAVPLPHNVVIGKAGTKDAMMATAMKVMTDPQAATRGFIPDNCPEMLAHTGLVQPGQTDSVTFTCAAPGDYPYMCMFPGHSLLMNGTIKAE
jgi:azurin